MAKPIWIRRWAGGRVRQGKNGGVFVIEAVKFERNYTITLDPHQVTSEAEALAELALFRRDPDAYTRKVKEVIPRLDEESIERFCEAKPKENLTPEHIENVLRHYSEDWREGLFRDRDIRTVQLSEMQQWLRAKDPKTGKQRRGVGKRIVALKSFTYWLRKVESTLDRKDDPTLELSAPPTPRKKTIEEKTYSIEHIEAIYSKLNHWSYKAGTGTRHNSDDTQAVRDVIRIVAHTGLHLSEVNRLAMQRDEDGNLVGEIKRLPDQPAPIAGCFVVHHKTGKVHRVAVDQATLEAGLRLQACGSAPEKSCLHKHLDLAARAAKMPEIEPGSLRHSFVSWGSQVGAEVKVNGAGVQAEVMARVAGHSLQTSLKHYRNAIEPWIVLPLNLAHPSDPEPRPLPSKPLQLVKAS